VLELVDAVEALGIDPADVAPEYWHHVYNRLSVNAVPRTYTRSCPPGMAASAVDLAMTRRATTLLFTVGAAALALSTITAKPPQHYIWNASGSVPVGPHRLQPTGDLSIAQFVAVQPPEPLATLLSDRGCLPRGAPMLKRFLALPGQTVCRDEFAITVDDITIGEARERDSLPVWQGCRVVSKGEVFLMNWLSADSLDGRYFGVLPTTVIIGRAESLWTGVPIANFPQFLCSVRTRAIPPSRPSIGWPSRAMGVQGGRQAGTSARHP
jgi:type IV secretory pathway protease TraF